MDAETTPTEETRESSLNHFASLSFLPSFWQLPGNERREQLTSFLDGLETTADAVHLYQSYPIEAEADLLVWSAARVRDPRTPRTFFDGWSRAARAMRAHTTTQHTLWGFTRPSLYSKAKSSQEIEPLTGERGTYLIMYPFTKTADWYLLGPDTRQGMMNQHMRIGKQYREITQLLLYSFGLQDQEFIVVYETEDLELFSKLVYDLRDTEARRYTKGDTPLHTGVHVSREALIERLG